MIVTIIIGKNSNLFSVLIKNTNNTKVFFLKQQNTAKKNLLKIKLS